MLTIVPKLSWRPVDSAVPEFITRGRLVALPEPALADAAERSIAHSTFFGDNLAPLKADSAEELAHDARNFLSAVDVYCELLAAPQVLTPGFRHYAEDLHHLARTGARLLEQLAGRLASAPCRDAPIQPSSDAGSDLLSVEHPFPTIHPFPPIGDLADELLALESPLRSLAGPDVHLEIECAPCAGQLGLNSEALLRILFNLIANTVEAMQHQSVSSRRKFVRISAQRGGGASFFDCAEEPSTAQFSPTVLLSIRDNGPGIAPGHLSRIFEPGFSTRLGGEADPSSNGGRASQKDGQPSGRGLAIVRRLVESAGGTIRAVSTFGFGTRFDIELPVALAANPPGGIYLPDGESIS